MKYILVALGCILFALLAPPASASELKSPDGNLVVDFEFKDFGLDHDCPSYRITYKGREVLKDSRLGLELEQGPLVANFEVAGEARTQANQTWTPVCGERSPIPDHYNQLAIDLRETQSPRRMVRVAFRAYDEGLAFCYTLPQQANLKDFTINAERTQFHFGGDVTTWAVYTAQADYTHAEVPLSQVKPGAERPFTVRIADDLYASITEARCVDYARMKLRPAKDQPNTLEAFLNAERGVAGKVTGVTPFTSPWRVVMVADSPGKLLEHNYLIPTLNDPCAPADTSWIKPGKVIREVTLTTAGSKACVDFCLARGLQYIELDSGWYGSERDPRSDATAVDPKRAARLDLQEVIRYANAHGIGVILYVNQKALEQQREVLFPLYEKWGVK
ncbi:MAG TPA: glycoside hydrolase family 97 N-terminal domain-containing protein, partial [Tepidisphaeraceae bacterium]